MIILTFARKPFPKTLLENVDKLGTGGINIESSRIPGTPWSWGTQTDIRGSGYGSKSPSEGYILAQNVSGGENGRWPPNVVMIHHKACSVDNEQTFSCNYDCPVERLRLQTLSLKTSEYFKKVTR